MLLFFNPLYNSAVLKLPSGQNKPLTYLVTLLPPLVLSLLDPEIFFKALDFAGTYGGKDPFAVSLIQRKKYWTPCSCRLQPRSSILIISK